MHKHLPWISQHGSSLEFYFWEGPDEDVSMWKVDLSQAFAFWISNGYIHTDLSAHTKSVCTPTPLPKNSMPSSLLLEGTNVQRREERGKCTEKRTEFGFFSFIHPYVFPKAERNHARLCLPAPDTHIHWMRCVCSHLHCILVKEYSKTPHPALGPVGLCCISVFRMFPLLCTPLGSLYS